MSITIRYKNHDNSTEIKDFRDVFDFQNNCFGINGSQVSMITICGADDIQIVYYTFTGLPSIDCRHDSVVYHGDFAKFIFANREFL